MSDASKIVWTETSRVLSYQCDATARLSVPALLGLMEEAAGNSAHALRFSVEDLMGEGISWVLARLRLRFSDWPRWRDDVSVETWPSGTDGLRAFREYRLAFGDGRRFGAATSVWMVLDLATRKLTSVPARLSDVVVPDRPRELDGEAAALPRLARPERSSAFRVRWADLDLNRHANHACYVDWALETVPSATREQARITTLAVDFRAEARFEDEVVAEAQSEDAPAGRHAFLHRIVRPADGRELAVLRTEWTD